MLDGETLKTIDITSDGDMRYSGEFESTPEYYNNHYINIDENKNVIAGWSDGPHNNRTPTDNDILINEKGGYQFRLIFEDGSLSEENPSLYTGMTRVPLYKWDGEKILRRSEEEIEADCEAIETEMARKNRISKLKRLLQSTDYVVIKIAEGSATKEEYASVIEQRKQWRDEINQLEAD